MNERWIWAAIAVGAGLLLGAAVALVIRRQLSRAHRRLAIQEIAKPLSTFAFWIVFATGVLVAVAVSSPQHLETVPTELLAWLPRLAIAGLLVIGGYAVGLTIAPLSAGPSNGSRDTATGCWNARCAPWCWRGP